ncbi:MAG: hypothetical protein HYR84_10475 [Planctomycetes bacterium]|nr:hypothetical protein [Planctomycetota bacterium]
MLRSQPADLVNFEALVADSGLTWSEADSVANDLYRLMADRIAADGVITPKERQKLRLLAKALRMAPDRASNIEAEANSARYRQAENEALADGVVTPEESRMLDDIRANLGIHETGRPGSELVPRD